MPGNLCHGAGCHIVQGEHRHLDLKKGDVVAVEASPGHDIGVVTLTGRLVKLQKQ